MSISSSVYPLTNFVLYYAKKVLNDYFSRGISNELQNKVEILGAKPFFVNSSTVNLTNNGLTVTSTQQFVNSILDQQGYVTETYGYWTKQALGEIFKNFVEYILFYVFII